MANSNKDDMEIIKGKDSIAKQEYALQQTFIDQRTVHLIIENSDKSNKLEEIKALMDLDLNYKEQSSKIKNNSIAENPIFIVDSKNEENKRILNYLLWIIACGSIPLLMYSTPISAFFIGVVTILSVLTVSFNTRVTTSDRRMMSALLEKLIKHKSIDNNGRKTRGRK